MTVDLHTGKAGLPTLCALRARHCGSPALPAEGNSRRFGYASPSQAAEAVPAMTKTTAVAFIGLLMTTSILVGMFYPAML